MADFIKVHHDKLNQDYYVKDASAVATVTVSNSSLMITRRSGTSVSVKLPDSKQAVTLATTSKAYLTGVTTTPTGTAQELSGVADTSVFLTTTSGQLLAESYKVTDNVTMVYDTENGCLSVTVI